MRFPALTEFLKFLESKGELKRITAPVDSHLEITEIAVRALHEKKPALLFENVKGAKYPLAINIYASEKRIELALGKHPQEFGEELLSFFQYVYPVTIKTIWKGRNLLRSILLNYPKIFSKNISQEIIELPNLNNLPILTCWPEDGGKFITQGLVFTYNPINSIRNIGLYRLQVYDGKTTGMHWQIQKGGGFHYYQAQNLNRPLNVAVALGVEPAVLFAGISALPEGVDELIFASFLSGKRIPMTKGKSIKIEVPAKAEFILEGVVYPNEQRLEGPFGDHFGYYSNKAKFPVFHIHKITHRKNPIYPATVVGIPPMEDKFMGDAVQWMLNPLLKLIHNEIYDLWAYYEAGFHNLLVVSVEERYQKEAMKTAFGIFGMGQLSLTKTLILVSKGIDPRNWQAVLNEIHCNFNPTTDFFLISGVPQDTLDFTSYKKELGSKMIIDATRKNKISTGEKPSTLRKNEHLSLYLKKLDKRIKDVNLIKNTLLIVKVENEGKAILTKLVKDKNLKGVKIIAVVNNDIDINNQESYIWGIFTRFDCQRDIIFTNKKFIGINPVYEGILGIDATLKKGYPKPLEMDEKIRKLVDQKWEYYWK